METRTDCFAPRVDWSNPWASWEAATRWNALAVDWMAKGWRQWLQLMMAPASLPVRAARADASPGASAPRRVPPKRPARSKTRTRG